MVFCLFSPSDEENSRHVVVNCSEALLKNNTYWPLVSDFINILSHQSVAKKFLEDLSLLMLWMSFVSFFQGNIILISMWLSPFFLCRKKYYMMMEAEFGICSAYSKIRGTVCIQINLLCICPLFHSTWKF